MLRNFFGSGHGKGPADGCSGAMIACTVINSVTYFFDYFKAYLTKNESDFKSIFNFVQGVDITRPDKTAAKTLQGTSQCKRGFTWFA